MGSSIILLSVGLTVIISVVVAYILKKRRIEKLISKIPGPPVIPLLGNSLEFASVKNAEDLWRTMVRILNYDGGIQRIWLGPVLAIIVDDPAYANLVLTHSSSANKHPWYNVFSFVKNGVFTTNGEHYERLRKPLSSSLHPKIVTNWHDLIASKALQAVNVLEKEIGKGEFDISEVTTSYSLDLVCRTLLGIKTNELVDKKFNFRQSIAKAIEISFQRVCKPQYFIDYIFYMTETGRKFKQYSWDTNKLLRHVVETRIKELKSRGINLKSDFEVEFYTDTVIKMGYAQDLTLEDMGKMLCDIPLAGSDTSAISAAFMILYLAVNPEYQQEAYDEQIAVLGDTDRPPTVEELGRMPFLAWVEKEVHRLHGPPLIARYTEKEMDIGGYRIPKGTTIGIMLHKLHRNPQIYERPNEFDPHRFSPENVAKRPKNSFIPFSVGHRRCPGALFAHLIVATLVSVLLRRYKFTTSLKRSEMKCIYGLMVESANGYPVQITRRNS